MNNITLKQYAQLKDTSKYDMLLGWEKPANNVGGQSMDVNTMPYANVKYCIRLLTKAGDWSTVQQLFEICFDIDKESFWKMSVKEFFSAKKYLTAEFERVIITEAKLMSSMSTDAHLWQMAGADKLKPYNDTLPLIQLGKLFGQYPFELGRKPYSEIFSLLVQIKTQGEVENEYQKLISK